MVRQYKKAIVLSMCERKEQGSWEVCSNELDTRRFARASWLLTDVVFVDLMCRTMGSPRIATYAWSMSAAFSFVCVCDGVVFLAISAHSKNQAKARAT